MHADKTSEEARDKTREQNEASDSHYIAFFQFEITGRVDDNKGQGIALLGDIVIIFRGKTCKKKKILR